MATKKVKRWRSRPASKKGGTYATYPKPGESEVYKVRRNSSEPKEPSALQREYAQQQQKKTGTKQVKKKRKYKSAPASKVRAQSYTPDSERERLRREKVQRKKRNNVFIRVAIAAAFCVVAALLSIFIFFKIGEIKVVGSEKYTAAQIIEASEISLGDNLFAPTAAGIQHKLDTALPYVRTVTIKHQLPDILIISVKEASAQFAFKSANKTATKYILTDEDLKFLEVSDKPPKGAAVIEGVGIQGADLGEKATFKEPEKGELVKQIKAAFVQNKLDNITRIDVSSIVDIQVEYNGCITVQIGQAKELDYKCKLAAKAIEDALKENKNAAGTVNVKQADQTKQAYFNPKQ